MSNVPLTFAASNGWRDAVWSASRGKYSSSVRPFDEDLPGPELHSHPRDRGLAAARGDDDRRSVGVGATLDLRQADLLGLLRRVRMDGAGVHLELPQELPAERVLREHAAHRVLDHALGALALENARGRVERVEPIQPVWR